MNNIVFSYSQLKARLIDRGVTQSTLAKDIGMSEKTLEKILNDGLPFKIKDIKNICKRLHIQHTDINEYFFKEQFDHNEQKSTINKD